ncbi:hypothetical protein Hdeb2414_s0016g00495171 [Helianthus debilis subsp. tardiflorus]
MCYTLELKQSQILHEQARRGLLLDGEAYVTWCNINLNSILTKNKE